jgi:hypothetical protein
VTKFNGANVLHDEVRNIFETNTRGDKARNIINPLDLNIDQNTQFSQENLESGHVEVIIPPETS